MKLNFPIHPPQQPSWTGPTGAAAAAVVEGPCCLQHFLSGKLELLHLGFMILVVVVLGRKRVAIREDQHILDILGGGGT